MYTSLMSYTASSTRVLREESPPCHSYGFLSCPQPLCPSNGSSGAIPSPSHTLPENSLVISKILVSVMSWVLPRWAPPRSLISCSPSTRACSQPLPLPLPLEPSLSVGVCYPVSFSCSSGRPSSMTLLHAGPGTPRDGFSRWEDSISQVEPRCTLCQAAQRSRTR